MKVWIVHFVGDWEEYVFSSAEKAYNCIVDGLHELSPNYNDLHGMRNELDEDYKRDNENFGIQNYADAEAKEVDEYC